MQGIQKAESIEAVYGAFRNKPLSIAEIDEFYQETESARGGNPRVRIRRKLLQEPAGAKHFLFVGYKGGGKSTELNHLERDIQDKFLMMNFSVFQELDPVHLSYIELFIVMMERLFKAAEEHKINVSKEYLKSIQHWSETKEIQEIKEKYIALEGEAGAGFGIPYFKTFFAKFKAAAKTSASLKEVLKQNVEPKLSVLIEHCNVLIREIQGDLGRIGKTGLVIIIEDLDKIPLERAKDIFLNYSHQLVSIRANVIFTFPISLRNSLYFTQVKSYFDECFELPMIEVRHRDGSKNDVALRTMKKMVEDRMPLSLFKPQKSLEEMILDSGGCIRDLFRMINDAADAALDESEKAITDKHRREAFLRLRKDYANSIADHVVEGGKIEAKRFYQVLVDLARSARKQPENDEALLLLRDGLCVLDYNGEGWTDVHPIVKSILKDRGKWDGKVDPKP